MPGRPVWYRRQYLVDRSYQLRFVTRLFLAVLVVAVTAAFVASALVWKHLSETDQGASLWATVCLVSIAATLLVEMLIAIPLIFMLGVRQSHSIVGPMQRIKRGLDAISRGEFSHRITCRRGDALEELVGWINHMAEALDKRQRR